MNYYKADKIINIIESIKRQGDKQSQRGNHHPASPTPSVKV